MERPDHIDDLMRQRLRHTEVPPPAFVWPNVERALRRRKRRLFLFWFLTGSLATGLLAAGLWMLWNQTETPVAPQPVAHVEPAAPAPERTSGIMAEKNTPIGLENTETASGKERSAAIHTNAKPSPIPAHPASAGRPDNAAPAGKRLPASKAGGNQLSARTNQSPEQLRPDVSESSVANLPTAPEESASSSLSPNSATAPAMLLPVSQGLLRVPVRENAPATVQTPPPAKTKRAPKKCYDFHSHPNAWLVDAYAGPSWAGKHFKTSDSELQDYLLDRERTEIRTWGYNAGLRASYLFAGNFLLRTGLHFDHFEEQFEYIDPNFIRYNITITQQYINNQWVSVTDTIGIEYGTNYLKTYNRYALLDIPLQAALELRSGATGVSLNLGGSVNVLFEKRGSILDTTGKPASFTPGSGPNEVFRTSLGMSLMGSIQWFYHLNPRTRVFVEPYYRHILDPVTRPDLPYEQTYGVGGVRLGLTRIFD